MKQACTWLVALLLLSSTLGCAGGNLTTREKGAGIGALGGAAVGRHHRRHGWRARSWRRGWRCLRFRRWRLDR